MLEGVIPLETFPLVQWHYGELADVPSFTVLKTQICVTRPQCVKITAHLQHVPQTYPFNIWLTENLQLVFWQRSSLGICRKPGCTHCLLRQHNRFMGQTKHLSIHMSVWCRNKWHTFLSVSLSQSVLGPTQPVRHDSDESAGGALHGTAPVCHRRRWRPGRKRNAHTIRLSLLAKYSHCWGKESV